MDQTYTNSYIFSPNKKRIFSNSLEYVLTLPSCVCFKSSGSCSLFESHKTMILVHEMKVYLFNTNNNNNSKI